MKVLLIGSGGREHALAWKIAQSPKLSELHAAPGNSGIADHATCHNVRENDLDGLAKLAQKLKIDLVICGPEAPLVAGIANRMKKYGINCVGPSAAGARIEGSKVFAKELMDRAQVPTSRWEAFSDVQAALAAINRWRGPVVIKADGLTDGRGAFVCMTKSSAEKALTDLLVDSAFGIAGRRVIVEELMQGAEASLMVLTDGKTILPLPVVAAAKRRDNKDQGANTDGMGAWLPVLDLFDSHVDEAVQAAIRPALDDLGGRGLPYTGVLYADVMFTRGGPKILEFNCRFGDIETQALVKCLDDDLLDLLHRTTNGTLDKADTPTITGAAVAVATASPSYPAKLAGADTASNVDGVDAAQEVDEVDVFINDAIIPTRGKYLKSVGGRPVIVSAAAGSVGGARDRAHEAIDQLSFDGIGARRDIAEAAIEVEALV